MSLVIRAIRREHTRAIRPIDGQILIRARRREYFIYAAGRPDARSRRAKPIPNACKSRDFNNAHVWLPRRARILAHLHNRHWAASERERERAFNSDANARTRERSFFFIIIFERRAFPSRRMSFRRADGRVHADEFLTIRVSDESTRI